jgi:hypothetical protein
MEIKDGHVEWAVVHRLGTMLEQVNLDREQYGTTHAFALFSAVTIWVRQRVGAYTGYDGWPRELKPLQLTVFSPPWELPPGAASGITRLRLFRESGSCEVDLTRCSMWQFVVWFRNAMAHGDHRCVYPKHEAMSPGKPQRRLTGFRFECSGGTAELTAADMQCIGRELAGVFCRAFGGNECWTRDATEGVIEQVAA